MKKLCFFLSAGLMASLLTLSPAQAGAIVGSQAFNNGGVLITQPVGGDNLGAATEFSVTLQTSSAVGAQKGDYVGFASETLPAATLNVASLGSFTYGDAAFGKFTATSGVELSSPSNTRTFYIQGNFTPGTGFSGMAVNTASILIQFTQVGGPGNAISFSATQNTPAASPPVPEPASLALAGIGICFVSLFRELRNAAAGVERSTSTRSVSLRGWPTTTLVNPSLLWCTAPPPGEVETSLLVHDSRRLSEGVPCSNGAVAPGQPVDWHVSGRRYQALSHRHRSMAGEAADAPACRAWRRGSAGARARGGAMIGTWSTTFRS